MVATHFPSSSSLILLTTPCATRCSKTLKQSLDKNHPNALMTTYFVWMKTNSDAEAEAEVIIVRLLLLKKTTTTEAEAEVNSVTTPLLVLTTLLTTQETQEETEEAGLAHHQTEEGTVEDGKVAGTTGLILAQSRLMEETPVDAETETDLPSSVLPSSPHPPDTNPPVPYPPVPYLPDPDNFINISSFCSCYHNHICVSFYCCGCYHQFGSSFVLFYC